MKWLATPLGEIITPVQRPEIPVPGKRYRQIGVRLWGEGAYERESIDGAETRYAHLYRAEADDIIVNKIWARNGSVAVVDASLAGTFGSNEFPMFTARQDRLDARWIRWATKTPGFWDQCDEKSRGTSGQNRIRPERFLEIEIPLPPLKEQRSILARIEKLALQLDEVRALRQQQQNEMRECLASAFWEIARDVPRRPMQEVAPIVRRVAVIDPDGAYPEVGIRSFGKGTFHKPAVKGIELGTKRLFTIEPRDLVFMNVFAWEGAVAVAKAEDKGRYGSHRFISCVPNDELATPDFLCFYFLTDEGLSKLLSASPGGAGRNRTLGLSALGRIEVPVPSITAQRSFDDLHAEFATLTALQAEASNELEALMPAVLDRAFAGAL